MSDAVSCRAVVGERAGGGVRISLTLARSVPPSLSAGRRLRCLSVGRRLHTADGLSQSPLSRIQYYGRTSTGVDPNSGQGPVGGVKRERGGGWARERERERETDKERLGEEAGGCWLDARFFCTARTLNRNSAKPARRQVKAGAPSAESRVVRRGCAAQRGSASPVCRRRPPFSAVQREAAPND